MLAKTRLSAHASRRAGHACSARCGRKATVSSQGRDLCSACYSLRRSLRASRMSDHAFGNVLPGS